MNTPQSIYTQFCEFEERAAAIYLSFASRFSKDPDLSSFWLDMAMHEKQHAGLLAFCLRDNLFAPNLPNDTEIAKLAGFFDKVEQRDADPTLTKEDAFTMAIELETSEINSIYCHLTLPLHSSTYLLRRKIQASLPNHVDELLAAARKFGVAEAILRKLQDAKDRCSGQFHGPE